MILKKKHCCLSCVRWSWRVVRNHKSLGRLCKSDQLRDFILMSVCVKWQWCLSEVTSVLLFTNVECKCYYEKARSSITYTMIKSLCLYQRCTYDYPWLWVLKVERCGLWWLWTIHPSLTSIFFCPPSPLAPAFDRHSRWLLWYEWTRKEVCPPPCLALIGSSSRMPWWLGHSAVLWVCQGNYSLTCNVQQPAQPSSIFTNTAFSLKSRTC